MSNIYKVENLIKTYKTLGEFTHALDSVSFEIEEGEIVVILGPSGSGKSTMLNLLSGIDNPTKGKIYFFDKRIDKYDEKNLLEYRKENLGFIFQSYNLISNLTVKENIELGAHLSENNLEINEMLKSVDILDQKNKYPYQLSGGQSQRVAIARALVKNPKVLFCDEPTGALDENTGIKILKLLQELNKKYKTTMIIVTHNPSIALMANTVIKMNSGKITSLTKNKKVVSAEEIGWA